jgi:hypothetical protein
MRRLTLGSGIAVIVVVVIAAAASFAVLKMEKGEEEG